MEIGGEGYEWQLDAIEKYDGKGIIKAVTGAGKTLSAIGIAESKGVQSALILTNSVTLQNQWKAILPDSDIPYWDVRTFYDVGTKDIEYETDILIVDECHLSVSPVFKTLYEKVKYKMILGLSATPNNLSIEYCGEPFIEIDYDEAKVCPFGLHFHGISLNSVERHEYEELTGQLKSLCRNNGDIPEKELQQIKKAILYKRRGVVYSAVNRIDKSMEIIKTLISKGRKILLISRRVEQANTVRAKLQSQGVGCGVCHYENIEGMDDYKKGNIKVMSSVNMLKMGFDDVDTDAVVIISTALTEDYLIQMIGRALRFKAGKVAEIHFLLARNTTDLKVLKLIDKYPGDIGFCEFQENDIQNAYSDNLKETYYSGEKYSFSVYGGFAWKLKDGRRWIITMEPNIIPELTKAKTKGGSFMITDKGVFAKKGKQIIKVTDTVPVIIDIKPPRDYSKKVTWKELFE